MGIGNIWKYWGMAMAGVQIATSAFAKIQAAQAPDSPGGTEILPEELVGLDEELTTAMNYGFQQAGIPVKVSISVEWVE